MTRRHGGYGRTSWLVISQDGQFSVWGPGDVGGTILLFCRRVSVDVTTKGLIFKKKWKLTVDR
jgi:hypothetical protein